MKNLLQTFENASPEEIEKGRNWYKEAHILCEGISSHFSLPMETVCGIMAMLSPANKWERNITDTISVIEKGWQSTTSTYGQFHAMAIRISEGESIQEVTKGKKVLSFYDNILYCFESREVTIDTHAFNIYLGRRASKKYLNKNRRKKGFYEKVANSYRKCAERLGIHVLELQAITCLTWKRQHNL